MDGRRPHALHLEMTDLAPGDYLDRRGGLVGDESPALFTNQVRDRTDLPRTLVDFDLLAVHDVDPDQPHPSDDADIVGSYRFVPTARPGQGSRKDEPPTGLQLVLISPRDPHRAQELRDWGDFVHIRHIAEAAVPGFGLITPYRSVGDGPTFLHFYELHGADPESAFQSMTPLVAERLGGVEADAYRDWAWHPQLRIDYVNTFARIEHP